MEAKALIDKANGYVKASDWINANSMVDQINSALNNAETKIKALEGGSVNVINFADSQTYLMAGGAIAVIAIGAVVVWMTKKTGRPLPSIRIPFGKNKSQFSPQPSDRSPAKAAVPKGGPGALSKLKEKLKGLSIRRKGSAEYNYHYQPSK